MKQLLRFYIEKTTKMLRKKTDLIFAQSSNDLFLDADV
jgi:hypothetical protein